MKISPRNTALHFLDQDHDLDFSIARQRDKTDQKLRRMGKSIDENWNMVRHAFRSKIRFISKPFYAAYDANRKKMANLFDTVEIEEAGTLVVQPTPSFTNTIFYYLKTTGRGNDWRYDINLIVFEKPTHVDKPILSVVIATTADTQKVFIADEIREGGADDVGYIAELIAMLVFLKYCPLETKVVGAGRREHHVGEKYVNETTAPVEILDSTWFTTIVRSEGFGVRGHLRLQPYGPGLSERRWQYIQPFEKHGYTRKAKILINGQADDHRAAGETESGGEDQGLHDRRGAECGQNGAIEGTDGQTDGEGSRAQESV